MIALLLLACKSTPTPVEGALAESGTRHELAQVHFNLWVDYIPMMGATDDACRFLDPVISDDTTPWPPLQAFWVIYEDPDDVDVFEMSDVFFAGDRVAPTDFGPLDGLEAIGFQFFSGFQANLLTVDAIRRDPGGQEIEADFGSPIDATLRLSAFEDGDGCATSAEYCREGECGAGFEPLAAIEIDLGTFYTVQDVRFR